MLSPTEVRAALRQVNDPELGLDIVSLGLIYDVTVGPKEITILMTLTTPGCPLVPYFQRDIEERVKEVSGVDKVTINITFDPPWNPDKMSADAKTQLSMLRG